MKYFKRIFSFFYRIQYSYPRITKKITEDSFSRSDSGGILIFPKNYKKIPDDIIIDVLSDGEQSYTEYSEEKYYLEKSDTDYIINVLSDTELEN